MNNYFKTSAFLSVSHNFRGKKHTIIDTRIPLQKFYLETKNQTQELRNLKNSSRSRIATKIITPCRHNDRSSSQWTIPCAWCGPPPRHNGGALRVMRGPRRHRRHVQVRPRVRVVRQEPEQVDRVRKNRDDPRFFVSVLDEKVCDRL